MMAQNKDSENQNEWSIRFIFISAVAYLIIPSLSYSLGSLNAPSEIIKSFINETEISRNNSPVSGSKLESLFGLLVAVVGIGGALGALSSTVVMDYIGRRNSIILATSIGLVGVLIQSLCVTGKSYEMLFVGRSLVGLAIGLGFSFAPTYVMEICYPNQKGAMAMMNQLSQSFAFLVTQVLGYEEILGNDKYWTELIGFPIIFLGLELILLPFCPQSPRYLLIKRNKEKAATEALRKLRGKEDVQDEIDSLYSEAKEAQVGQQVSVLGLLKTPILRRPLLVAAVMGLQQNWCGMNGIMFFSNKLFEDAGVEGRATRYATSGTGAVFFVCNIIALFLLPRFGRKTLFIAGTAGMGVFSAIFSITMIFKKDVDALKYVNIVVSLLIIACYSLGPVCVFWVLAGELFPHSARGAGISIIILGAFSGFFAHCYALPAMIESLGNYTFFVFAVIDLVMVVFCVFYMPETKNKTFAEIAKTWAKDADLEKDSSLVTDYTNEIVVEANGKLDDIEKEDVMHSTINGTNTVCENI